MNEKYFIILPSSFSRISVMSGAYMEENTEENNVGDDFDFGLERILDGIEQYLGSKKGQQSFYDLLVRKRQFYKNVRKNSFNC
ncbi:hypothetical protein GCM10011409_17680 [Lentibacillus populi]|uniref:Uncharacterized protein n=1 Tax=Lentibacillus populi TaxID=1827502 RepID=A0A9W5X548_9BACI|nr:hypothetical protein GCM10011409_17680 [Lentibacillus populi]